MTPAVRNSFTIIAMAIGIAIGTGIGRASTTSPHTIPNAAAEEARIVCANFSGLDSFTVQRLDDEATPEGVLRRYRITATCTSAHVVTGQIGVK